VVKFGLHLHLEGLSYSDVRSVATECEKLGFDSLWIYDHLLPVNAKYSEPVMECLTTLAALTSETKSLRLGTLVLCNSYRHPSVLAKIGATLDVISNGRLEFGIGAGWKKDEYQNYGVPFPDASIRIRQLRESVQIIKKMWTEDKATFKGEYYSITNAICEPKPIQKPHPPIWIGGQGEKLMLKVVAELADGCNFLQTTPEEYEQKLDVLKRHLLAYGKSMDEIQRSFTASLLIANDQQQVKKLTRRYVQNHFSFRSLSKMIHHPKRAFSFANEFLLKRKTTRYGIVGTPEQCIDQINEYVKLGVTYFMLNFPDVPDLTSLRLFAQRVMPTLKRE
jgi:F420-dependent oxidoreductase-like protein